MVYVLLMLYIILYTVLRRHYIRYCILYDRYYMIGGVVYMLRRHYIMLSILLLLLLIVVVVVVSLLLVVVVVYTTTMGISLAYDKLSYIGMLASSATTVAH